MRQDNSSEPGDGVTVQISVPAGASRFDRLESAQGMQAVSERVQRFWSLPSEVAMVEVISEEPVVVSAYTRPDDLPHRIRVSDAMVTAGSSPDNADEVDQPVWFGLLPVDADNYEQDGRRHTVLAQLRPPEVNPALTDETHRFEQLKPTSPAIARDLVSTRPPGQPWRPSALPSAFRPLISGRPNKVKFKSLPGQVRVSPTLIYRQSPDQPEPAPFRLVLRLSDRVWFDQHLGGVSGQVRLPSISPGEWSIHAQAPDGVDLHINMSGASETDRNFNRRLVYRLGREPVEFGYQRRQSTAQSIAIRWFSEGQSDSAVRLRAELTGVARSGLHDSWTLTERVFEITPAQIGDGYLLGRHRRPVGTGQVFYIGIGTDLAPGDYRVRLSVLSETDGYVALSRLDPGDRPSRTYLVEKDVDD